MLKYDKFNEAIDLEKLRKFAKGGEKKIVKDELNPVVWEDNKLKDEVRERLLLIAEDFFDGLELGEGVKFSDIILVGSMANFNWHRGSDFDVHIVIDFSQINDDLELVQEYLELQRKMWNSVHNIYMLGYPVELSTQGTHETIHSAGVYSILNNKWINHPKHVDVPIESEDKATRIANRIAKQIEDISYEFNTGDSDPFETYQDAKLVWKKIKALRLGLAKHGEFDPKNLAFKKLRTDGYLEKITKLKAQAYDKIFSLDLHPELK